MASSSSSSSSTNTWHQPQYDDRQFGKGDKPYYVAPHVPVDCVLLYRASNNAMADEACDSQIMWAEDAYKECVHSALDFSRAAFVWAAILHVERNQQSGIDRCISFSKDPRVVLERAKANNLKYIHVAMIRHERVVDLSSFANWKTSVKAWIDRDDETFIADGRDCSRAFAWSTWLQEVVCDRVKFNDLAVWSHTIDMNDSVEENDLKSVGVDKLSTVLSL